MPDRNPPHNDPPPRPCQCGSRAHHQYLMELAVPDGCEWDPDTRSAALDCDRHARMAPARVILGGRGRTWRLCESCAAQAEFRRYRKRVCVQCFADLKRTAHKMTCSFARGHGAPFTFADLTPEKEERL